MNKKSLVWLGWSVCVILLIISLLWHRFTFFQLFFALFLGLLVGLSWGGRPEKIVKIMKEMTPSEREKFLEKFEAEKRKEIQEKVESHHA